MLWNIVFEFFVKYIFGGVIDGAYYHAYIGDLVGVGLEDTAYFSAGSFTLTNGQSYAYCLGNYLSLIATIISMVAIIIICCLLIKKIYNICAHVIG